ncbi:hypothetical protein EBR78_07630, partial [bacterium]|nr:hypothetical protein [bacterium]
MRVFLLLILSGFLWSCSAVNNSSSGSSEESLVQGVIQLARVRGAKVEVFLLVARGVKGPKIAQTFTNNSGEYQLRLSKTSGPVIIISTGGEYIDEADQQPKTAPELSTIVDASVASNAPLSPISTLLKERTVHLMQTQLLVPAQARELAKGQVATLFGLSNDDIDVLPADPYNTTGASEKAMKSAVAIAAFSHFIENNFNQHDLSSILQTLKEDFQDGKLDNGGPVAEAWAEKMLEAKQDALDNNALDFADFKANGLANAMSFHPGTSHVFVNGTKLSGFCVSGSFGCQTGSFYQNGILAQGDIAGICYKDGRPLEGLAEQNSGCSVGSCFSSGLLFSGVYNSTLQSGNCENGSSYLNGLWMPPQPPPEDNSSDNPSDSGGSAEPFECNFIIDDDAHLGGDPTAATYTQCMYSVYAEVAVCVEAATTSAQCLACYHSEPGCAAHGEPSEPPPT